MPSCLHIVSECGTRDPGCRGDAPLCGATLDGDLLKGLTQRIQADYLATRLPSASCANVRILHSRLRLRLKLVTVPQARNGQSIALKYGCDLIAVGMDQRPVIAAPEQLANDCVSLSSCRIISPDYLPI